MTMCHSRGSPGNHTALPSAALPSRIVRATRPRTAFALYLSLLIVILPYLLPLRRGFPVSPRICRIRESLEEHLKLMTEDWPSGWELAASGSGDRAACRRC